MTATLEQLEARIAALEAKPPPDQLTPNVLTFVNGQVGADYTGLLQALGLYIPAGTKSSPPATNRINWTSDGTPAGALIAQIYGWTAGGSDYLTLEAADEVFAQTSAGQVDVFDSLGASNFLQIGAARRSQLVTGTITWPGGSIYSNYTYFSDPSAATNTWGVGCATGDVVSAGTFVGEAAVRVANYGNYAGIAATAIGFTPPANATVNFAALIAWA